MAESNNAVESDEITQSDIPALLNTARRDRIYVTKDAYSFAFGSDVAAVFDDMISRSVPCYLDLQLLVASSASRFFQPGTAIYDLGCSTGTSLALIAKRLPKVFDIYGIDNSKPMLLQAEKKLSDLKVLGQVILKRERLQDVEFRPASFITANYTFQFLPEVDREPMFEKVYSALVPGGAFILSEKTQPDVSAEHLELVKELHEDFKSQNGYSLSEVARKRESLRGVMRPIGERENISQLQNAGFQTIIPMIRGYSFISWLCIK
ncbi:MAG: methyltransferase domain-containing protein [Bdellovibrionales bacterium]|nr:methyltransferase domain-containing protein [Bdellovibrionales bacterium]